MKISNKNLQSARPRTRLIVVGGFLGAGKTTAVVGLAKRLIDRGLSLGIVTNDQGSDLVDTETMRRNGLPVIEIAGGCFCCHFDQFADKLDEMGREHAPDIVLVEPVGSCINLVATVMNPLERFSRPGGRLSLALAPLSVLVDPRRLARIVKEEKSPSALPDRIGYLFRKQMEEADYILLNKCDLLSEEDRMRSRAWLEQAYPGATVLEISATQGIGMDEWADQTAGRLRTKNRALPDIAYETYAVAEADLAWLNTHVTVSFPEPSDANPPLIRLAETIRDGIAVLGGDTVHLKAHLVTGNDWAKVSCTGNDVPPSLDHHTATRVETASLVLNIRAVADPEALRTLAVEALNGVFGPGLDIPEEDLTAFRPAYAGPTYTESGGC